VAARRRTHTELKRATRDLVRKLGGLKVAAGLLGLSISQVQRYTDVNSPDEIGISQVLLLEREAGERIVSGVLVHLLGDALLSLSNSGRNGIHARYGKSMRAVVELSALYADAARRDPNISQADVLQLARSTHEALSRISEFLAALHAKGAA
jgi:hypothetical protein